MSKVLNVQYFSMHEIWGTMQIFLENLEGLIENLDVLISVRCDLMGLHVPFFLTSSHCFYPPSHYLKIIPGSTIVTKFWVISILNTKIDMKEIRCVFVYFSWLEYLPPMSQLPSFCQLYLHWTLIQVWQQNNKYYYTSVSDMLYLLFSCP